MVDKLATGSRSKHLPTRTYQKSDVTAGSRDENCEVLHSIIEAVCFWLGQNVTFFFYYFATIVQCQTCTITWNCSISQIGATFFPRNERTRRVEVISANLAKFFHENLQENILFMVLAATFRETSVSTRCTENASRRGGSSLKNREKASICFAIRVMRRK